MSGAVLLALRILTIVSLYTFLLWAIFLLWRGIKNESIMLASRKVPPLRLAVHHTDTPVQTKHFTQPEITIGRDPACECYLDEDTVSVRHARLSYHHGQWWLEDLDSTNGTLLNNEKVTTPTVITNDDIIACGTFLLSITLADGIITNPSKEPLIDDSQRRSS